MAANILANLGDWSTSDASNQPDGTDTTDIAGEYRRIQAVVRKYLATATTLAAGATTDLATAAGNTVTLTGAATTISSFGTVSAGLDYTIIANAAHTLTYNATSMILPTSADITLAAGDVLVMTSEGSGNWRCKSYLSRAGYQPLDDQLTTLAGITAQQATDLASVSTFIGTLLDDADADTARATLGAASTDAATDAAAGLVELATSAEVKTGTDTERAMTPAAFRAESIVYETPVTVSGTSVDFTGIPSWAKRITVSFAGLSTNGTSPITVQIGDAGGIESTGYFGTAATGTTAAALDIGFSLMQSATAASAISGTLTLVKHNGNAWAASGVNGRIGSNINFTGGHKELSDVLTQIRVTTVNGTDQFDAGTLNILYE